MRPNRKQESILKEIKNLINNQTFLIEDQNEGESVTQCMDVYKAKIQYDGSFDKLKLRIVVRGDLQNKEMAGDTWSTIASMRTLKYLLADSAKHKARVHQLSPNISLFYRYPLTTIINFILSRLECVQSEN